MRLTASNALSIARAFLDLHRAYRQTQERLASLDEAWGATMRAFNQAHGKRCAIFFITATITLTRLIVPPRDLPRTPKPRWIHEKAIKTLHDLGITVRSGDQDATRIYDPNTKILTISNRISSETARFQILLQLALISQEKLLEATLDLARFQSPEARAIAKIGLANYFAGAALMPYKEFLETARMERHDLERLSRHFGVSIEQVAHRLSTLQRPETMAFHSSSSAWIRQAPSQNAILQHGFNLRGLGACPLWNVHRAFETPGQFLRQLAETPDGIRYLSIARDVTKGGGSFNAPLRRFAIALGCEVKHAEQLVYADGLDLARPDAFEPIGISCRLCERRSCHQRSVPR